MIYLDHNATTPLHEQVLETMLPFLGKFYANPSSLYRAGRMVRSAIDTARQQVAALVSASPEEIIFTSGGTEANNLALKGFYSLSAGNSRCAVSAIEHPSILETAGTLWQATERLLTIPVSLNGLYNLEYIRKLAQSDVGLVSVMLANNETGAIQDIATLADVLAENKIILHTDAVQAIGKIPVDFKQLRPHLMTLSSHKIYGPKGCGALVIDRGTQLQALICGGGQEFGMRAGTENVAAIVGFGKAAELAMNDLQQRQQQLHGLMQQLLMGLKEIPDLQIFADQVEKIPNTVQFGIPGMDGEMLLMQLDRKSIAVSSGSACASGGGQASHVLVAMGVNEMLAKSAIRISLGRHNTSDEIEHFLRELKAVAMPGL